MFGPLLIPCGGPNLQDEWVSTREGEQPNDRDVQVLLGLYQAERGDAAALMGAGHALTAALLAYVGVVAALLGQASEVAPVAVLATPIPVLGLLVVYTIHGYNQGLRATSSRTLESLLWTCTNYVPNLTATDLDHFGPNKPLREIAIGMHSSELFYNHERAADRHRTFLTAYYVIAAVVVLAFAVAVECYGITQAWTLGVSDWPWWWHFVIPFEIVFVPLLVGMFIWAWRTGESHRERAEDAAADLLNNRDATTAG